MKVYIVTETGKVVGEIKDCKTIKGAKGKIAKSSIAIPSGWIIRIEEVIK